MDGDLRRLSPVMLVLAGHVISRFRSAAFLCSARASLLFTCCAVGLKCVAGLALHLGRIPFRQEELRLLQVVCCHVVLRRGEIEWIPRRPAATESWNIVYTQGGMLLAGSEICTQEHLPLFCNSRVVLHFKSERPVDEKRSRDQGWSVLSMLGNPMYNDAKPLVTSNAAYAGGRTPGTAESFIIKLLPSCVVSLNLTLCTSHPYTFERIERLVSCYSLE